MKAATILTLLPFWALGCQPVAPAPPAGLSTLQVKVIAEPKAGVQAPAGHPQTFDTPGTGSGSFTRVNYADLDQIVVWLEPADETAPRRPAATESIIDINPSHPASGISAVTSVGATVVFRNTSGRPQTIYSVSDGNEFDRESVPAGGRASYTVRSTGRIDVLTDASPDPAAELYAAPVANVRLTHAGETIDFVDLPPGTYRLSSWHPRLPGTQTGVVLSPGQVTDAAIKVGVNSLPKISGW